MGITDATLVSFPEKDDLPMHLAEDRSPYLKMKYKKINLIFQIF